MTGSKTTEEKRRAKWAEYMRQQGTPLMVTPAELERLRKHLAWLHDVKGMSYMDIVASAPGNHNQTSVAKVVRQWTGTVHRNLYNDLMRAHYEPPTTGSYISPVGVQRRLQALVYEGYGYEMLGAELGVTGQAVYQLVTCNMRARASTALRIKELYERLYNIPPQGSSLAMSRAKGVARRRGWAPWHCWDDDTLDDPDAWPEWTGECGSMTGWRIHYRDDLPLCARCSVAHQIYRRYPNLEQLMSEED